MPLAVTIPAFGISKMQNKIVMQFTVVASGTYPTGGDTLNFITATYPQGYGPPPVTSVPVNVQIDSQHGSASAQTNEYQYGYATGTTNANGVMQVFTGAAAQTALTELSAGSYPAGVTGDVIKGVAVWDAF